MSRSRAAAAVAVGLVGLLSAPGAWWAALGALGVALVWRGAGPRAAARAALAAGGWCAGALVAGALGDAPPDALWRVALWTPWLLWLRMRMDAAALRAWALRRGAPPWLVELVDRMAWHGALIGQELALRREAALMRGAFDGPRRWRAWLSVVERAAEGALERAWRAEELRALRCGARGQQEEAVAEIAALEAVWVEHEDGCSPLRGVSARVGAGEWIALVGASGEGKTTLLRALAGLQAPSAGRVWRFGEPCVGVDRRGRVGLLCQDPDAHFMAATAREDVAWGLIAAGMEADAAGAEASRWLDRMGISGAAQVRPIERLSGGERRRAAAAGVLARRPALLLLDEPTGGLDAANARRLEAQIEASCGDAAVLWVTHDLGRLPARVSRIWMLDQGALRFDGAPDVLLASLAELGIVNGEL